MVFEFATAGRIRFGAGVSQEVSAAAAAFGGRALVVTGSDPDRVGSILAGLAAAGVTARVLAVAGEPTVALAQEAGRLAREGDCGVVVGLGGGSAIDTAKAAAALLTNPGDLLDYLEVVGGGLPLPLPAAPIIAVPTTAGTGSEVARNAVLAVPERGVKVSLRHPSLLPRLALVDPELTYRLPPAVTAASGLDALSQLIEPFTSARANPLTDAICRQAIPLAARALPRAYRDGSDCVARGEMSFASLCGGLALSNAGLGAVHGLAGVIGGMYRAPHGALCGRLLPFVVATNLAALRRQAPSDPMIARYAEIAAWLTGDRQAEAEEAAPRLLTLVESLGVPGLAGYGISAGDFPLVAQRAASSSSMRANPVPLTLEECCDILALAL